MDANMRGSRESGSNPVCDRYKALRALNCAVSGKGKAFPLQAWTGPWGSRRLRLQNF
jgi:hypothetical protein